MDECGLSSGSYRFVLKIGLGITPIEYKKYGLRNCFSKNGQLGIMFVEK